MHACCCVSVICSFLLLIHIPLYGCTRDGLYTHQLKLLGLFPVFRWLWIKLLWTFMYVFYFFVCEHMFSFILDNYIRVEFLSCMLYIFNFITKCHTFLKWLCHFSFLPEMHGSFHCIIIHSWFSQFLWF